MPGIGIMAAEEATKAIQLSLLEAPASGATRIAALEPLLGQVDALAEANPARADLQVWAGIISSQLAAARSNISSLGLVKDAREHFAAAEQRDPAALDWSVYSLLGYLYASVPGWPIAFGDRARAREYHLHAITLNPSGAEPHRSYGEFLLEEEEYAEAARELDIALRAPLRTDDEAQDDWVCNAKWCLRHSAETDVQFRDETRKLLETARAVSE
jgi:Tfp pilus assembly protein PilF